MKLRLSGILLSAVLACTCAAAAAVENPADGGVTKTDNLFYLNKDVTITNNYGYYADRDTVLNVGTVYGKHTLSIENGASVTVGNSLHIGGWGWGENYNTTDYHDGTVYVKGGAALTVNQQLNIGAGGPVTGKLVVNNASVTVGYGLNVGLGKGATGVLKITNGGRVLVKGPSTQPETPEGWSALTVGYYPGSHGTILIDGKGSSLKTEGYVRVWMGQQENTSSVIKVTDGAELDLTGGTGNTGMTVLGSENSSSAKIEVSGATLTMADTYVGNSGAGAIVADGGAQVTVKGDLKVSTAQDTATTAPGSVQISGANTTLTVNGNVYTGYTGSGDIVIADGAALTVEKDLMISGSEDGFAGQLKLDGAGTKLTVEGNTFVGYEDNSVGAVTVTNGADLTIDGLLMLGGAGETSASVTVSGANLTVTGGEYDTSVVVGSGSTITMGASSKLKSGGDVTFQDGSNLVFHVTDSSTESAPIVNASGNNVDFKEGSKVTYQLDKSLANSETGEFTLPSIVGNMTNEMPETEVYGPDGNKMEGEGTKMELLPDGTYGLQVKIERQAAINVLAPDAQRLVNTLWSSTGVVQEYGEAVLAHLNRPGSKNVWAMGLGSFQRMSSYGAATGYHYNGGGYAVGADTAVTENFNAGVSVGQMYGRHKAADGLSNVRQNSLMASLYGRYDLGRNKCGTHIMLDGYLGYGHTRNRARSWSDTNDEMITGRWGDDILALGLKGTWQRKLTDNSTIASFIGVRYLYGVQDDITMASANSSRDYYDGSMHNLSIPMGVTLRYYYAVGSKGVVSPSLTVGYIADVYRENPSLRTKVFGNCTKFEGSDPGRHAFMMRLGVGYQIDERWYVGAGYNLEARSSDLEQCIDMDVSYSF